MIQWLIISGYVLQNMLQVGFGKTFQNLSYFDQSVAYVSCILLYLVLGSTVDQTASTVLVQLGTGEAPILDL